MNEENKIAKQKQIESPIWNTVEDTHKCYNDNMKLLLENVKGYDAIFVASHN